MEEVPDNHVVDTSILEPFQYLCQVPGKDVRGVLIDSFQSWLNIDSCKLELVKDIVSSLHNASLLVDDIEDNSKMRRGVPVAHAIYGTPLTINCANYVYFLALEKCLALQNQEAIHVFTQELLNLHRGQGQDILWRDTCNCPSEEEYKRMVLDKTGGLFRLAVGLMQCHSDNKRVFTPLLNSLALYFQIRDDLINLCSTEYFQSKSFCEDLSEGKFSFPIIHSIRSNLTDTRLINILKQRTEDVQIKRYAVQYMIQTGSLQYTRTVLRDLRQTVLHEIAELGGHPKLEQLIRTLDDQVDACFADHPRPTENGFLAELTSQQQSDRISTL